VAKARCAASPSESSHRAKPIRDSGAARALAAMQASACIFAWSGNPETPLAIPGITLRYRIGILYGSRDYLIDDRRALRLAIYGHTYLGGCLYRYRKALGNRGRDDLRGLVPKTRAGGGRASMIPEPIALYKSGLVVLFNVSLFLFISFSLKLL
jgi:hypothetical protein